MVDVLAFDTSNYLVPSAATDPEGFRNFVRQGVERYNVRLWLVQGLPPSRFPSSQTSAQCEGVLAVEGASLGGYVYPFFDNGVGDAKARLQSFNPWAHKMVALGLDVEDTTSARPYQQKADIVDTWLEDCDLYLRLEIGSPQTTLFYTGQGVWDGMGFPHDFSRWAERNVWWANYDNRGTLDPGMLSRGGFKRLVLQQHFGSNAWTQYPIVHPKTRATYRGFDANVVSPEWWAELGVDMQLPDVGDDYWSKFGPEGNNTLADRTDWPSVAKNLEGIISSIQTQVADPTARDTVEDIRKVLVEHGYSA